MLPDIWVRLKDSTKGIGRPGTVLTRQQLCGVPLYVELGPDIRLITILIRLPLLCVADTIVSYSPLQIRSWHPSPIKLDYPEGIQCFGWIPDYGPQARPPAKCIGRLI